MLNTVTKWLDKTAAMVPDKKAIIDGKKSITFAEYFNKSREIAKKILQEKHTLGIDTRTPVVVYMKKGAEVLISFMGIAYSGGFYSPIDVEMPQSRVTKILEVLQPSIVVTSREYSNRLIEWGYCGRIIIYEDVENDEDYDVDINIIQEKTIDTDLLYVLFTSGSTGIPKGVTINHRSVIDYIDWVVDEFEITADDSFGNQAPFYFDNSILDIYSSIKTGATLYIIPKELFHQPVTLLRYLLDNNVSTIFWVPSALIVISKLKALKNVDLSKTLKRVLFCGEVMPNKQLNVWRSFLPDALYANLYGPTEITDACTFYTVNRHFSDEDPLPIGKPMRNTEILVLNEKDELVKKDEIGELCVRGTSLSMGYYRNPEKTNEVFVQNPLNNMVPEIIYRTGDLVRYNEYDELVYISRKDFQIKHLGHRIELGEIETATSSLDEISQCCALYDEKKKEIILVIDVDLKKDYIKEKLKELIPDYMLPGRVFYEEHMPLNLNGKIDRVMLRERFL